MKCISSIPMPQDRHPCGKFYVNVFYSKPWDLCYIYVCIFLCERPQTTDELPFFISRKSMILWLFYEYEWCGILMRKSFYESMSFMQHGLPNCDYEIIYVTCMNVNGLWGIFKVVLSNVFYGFKTYRFRGPSMIFL